MKYYIKERFNPQLQNTSFTLYGKISKKRVREIENKTRYGSITMHSYKTKSEYEARIQELKNEKKL